MIRADLDLRRILVENRHADSFDRSAEMCPGAFVDRGQGNLRTRIDRGRGNRFDLGGKIYSAVEVDRLADVFPHFATHTVSLCEGFYLGSENLFELDDAELFNHSCEPNTGVQGQILIVARRPIAAGEELTFDYDTTEISAEPFECRCGSARCRGTIDGDSWRNDDFVRANWPWLSWYIQEKIRREFPEMIPAIRNSQASPILDGASPGFEIRFE